ncbi:MAG: hypothetical protein RR922_02445 [Clostridia bacterium]
MEYIKNLSEVYKTDLDKCTNHIWYYIKGEDDSYEEKSTYRLRCLICNKLLEDLPYLPLDKLIIGKYIIRFREYEQCSAWFYEVKEDAVSFVNEYLDLNNKYPSIDELYKYLSDKFNGK